MKAVYKISVSLLSLAVIPAVIFLPFFKLVVTSDVLSLFNSSSGKVLVNDTYSFKAICDLALPYKEEFASRSLGSVPQNVRDALGLPATFFIGFFILAVLAALVVFFFGLFTQKKRMVAAFSGLGIAFTLGMNIAFENLSKPLVSGVVSVVDLVGQDTFNAILAKQSDLAGLFSKLVSSGQIIDIRLLNLSTCYIAMLLIFIAVLVITVSSVLVEWK